MCARVCVHGCVCVQGGYARVTVCTCVCARSRGGREKRGGSRAWVGFRAFFALQYEMREFRVAGDKCSKAWEQG